MNNNETSFHRPSMLRGRGLVIVMAAVIVALVIALVVVAQRAASAGGAERPTENTTTPTPAPVTSSLPNPARSPSYTVSGADRTTRPQPDPVLNQAIDVFISGWQEKDPTKRRDLLYQSAAPELAAKLMLTHPDNIITQPRTKTDVLGQGLSGAEVKVYFGDEQAILLQMSIDIGMPYQWGVTQVTQLW